MVFIIAAGLLVFFFFLVNINNNSVKISNPVNNIENNNPKIPQAEKEAQTTTPATQAAQPINNWQVGSVKDEMTDDVRPYLTNTSLNGVVFNFPYNVDGGSKLTIVIRQDTKEKVAYVLIEKGLMLCSYQSCTIQTRSETGAIKKWEALEASPGVHNVLFIRNANAFEKYIKENKKIRIGVEFYEYGVKSFDFDVSDYPGLNK